MGKNKKNFITRVFLLIKIPKHIHCAGQIVGKILVIKFLWKNNPEGTPPSLKVE